jgi:predicted nicotinamide N-methyase
MDFDSGKMPINDPIQLLRYREDIFAPDLLIAAAGWLDFFTWLANNPSSIEDICGSLDLAQRPVDVMLTLFSAMGLIENEGGIFRLTDLAEEFLVKDSPWDLGPYLASLRNRPVCREMFKVLKTGEPARWGAEEDEDEWAVAMEREDFAQPFTAAMDSRGAYLAPHMAQALDCMGFENLLDIAGGSGIYACAAVSLHEHMRAAILEKPPVDEAARSAISQRGMSDKVSVIAGDMFSGELPPGHDIHLYSHVLHDWDAHAARELMHKSYRTLSPGGMIAIYDAHINAEKTGPLPVAEYSVLLMFSTEGKCYSVKEMEDMLLQAGFEDIRYIPTVAYRSLITAIKV